VGGGGPSRRRLAGFLVGLLAMLGATGANAAPAYALPVPQASSCAGIWVVVDFAALGGGATAKCATTYTTGTAALRSAWGPDGVVLDSGMVVKINGLPTTPNIQQNYWSYWHATRQADGSYSGWSYSSLGSSAFQPGPNDAEGWRYEPVSGGYVAPSITPPRQTVVTQAPATTAPAAPATTARTTTAPKTTAAAAATTTTATAAATTASTDPAATSTDSVAPSASDTPTASLTAADTPSSSPEPPSASSTPTAQNRAATRSLLGGLGAIGAIAAGAAGVLWWRKRSVVAG
jgi:hypothetical protein